MPASAPAASLDRRSYAFLVERLLPRHLLSEARRAQLDAALAQSDRHRMYGETAAALAELVDDGILEELPSLDPGAKIYRRAGFTWDQIYDANAAPITLVHDLYRIEEGRLPAPREARAAHRAAASKSAVASPP